MAVVLIATLDTKGQELAFVRDRLRALGIETLVIDAGSLGAPIGEADIDRERVFFRAGADLDDIHARGDRGEAVAAAARGVLSLVVELEGQEKVSGVLAIGGSAGTTIGTAAMRALPFGIPKVMVSTLASGQTRPYVGGSDICMFHSVADIAGLNRLTRQVLANAAHAMAGMTMGMLGLEDRSQTADLFRESFPNLWEHYSGITFLEEDADHSQRPLIAATMFGVTTPCVDRARRLLDAKDCEVIIFHATGVGGQAMEGLIRDGLVHGVLDLTTTELADELVGGVLSAGPDRLEAAGRCGVAQVVSLGALDMVNFGPMSTVPDRFRERLLHVHNANVTLMRTTPEDNAALGRTIAERLVRSEGPTAVIVPRGGVSALDAPGKPFWWPEADAALFDSLRKGLEGHPNVLLIERDEHINDPRFAEVATMTLLTLMGRSEDLPGGDRMAPTWATESDVHEIAGLLQSCGLPTAGVREWIDGFLVVRGVEDQVVACAAVERHGKLGLVRSVVVAPELRGLGIGRRLVATLLNRAAADGLTEVVLQSRHAPDFFAEHLGFERIDRAAVADALAESASFRHEFCEYATVMRRSLQGPAT
jgi:uncharacterized protein (UPF0261 family)/N-acetylglutamate synthase-like GNAT family acetyltransferase